jgi:threonine synthase
MYSIPDANIVNLAIRGVFDDCQDLVKAIMADGDFKQRHGIGAVNSINWARVAAQVVYYFRAHFLAAPDIDTEIDIAVPTGNFGNILAGWVARKMGLPIRRLILATNENDVLDEFFRTGRYRVRSATETFTTSSPSMDISKASNFERFIFDLVGRDPATVRKLWTTLETSGNFEVPVSLERLAREGLVSGSSCHADRLRTIRTVRDNFNQVVDPHTADGLHVGLRLRTSGVPLVCLATAHPAKFAATLTEALGHPTPAPAAFAGLEDRPQRFTVLDADAAAVRHAIETLP